MIGKIVKTTLNTSQLSKSAKNDILFYVIYVVVARILGKTEITFDDLLTIDLTLVNNDVVNDAITIVYSKYTEKGASGSVAKSSSFIKDIIDTL